VQFPDTLASEVAVQTDEWKCITVTDAAMSLITSTNTRTKSFVIRATKKHKKNQKMRRKNKDYAKLFG
jgi:hypothetical protein